MADQQWEYRAITLGSVWRKPDDGEIEAALDDLGGEGWEVVGVTSEYGTGKMRFVAKRPLTGTTRRQRNWPG